MSAVSSLICRSLLAGDSASDPLAGIPNRLQAGSYIPGRRAAFTLVEVLVSLAIFAMAAVVLGATYVNILTNYQAAMTRPAQQAELALLRPALLAEPDRARAEKGAEQPLPGNRTARWQSRIEETAIADLFAVTFEWEIDEPGRRPVTGQEEFMLLRPTWSDPAGREKLREASRQRLAKREF